MRFPPDDGVYTMDESPCMVQGHLEAALGTQVRSVRQSSCLHASMVMHASTYLQAAGATMEGM